MRVAVFAHIVAQRADGSLQQTFVRDDVERRARVETADRNDPRLQRVDFAADDGLKGRDDLSGDGDRVDGVTARHERLCPSQGY